MSVLATPKIACPAREEWPQERLAELVDDLWSFVNQREGVAVSPDAPMSAVEKLDRRIAAAVDALVLAEHQAYGPLLCAVRDRADRASGMSVGLCLALDGSEEALSILHELWADSDPALREGLRLGLGALEARDRSRLAAPAGGDAHRAASAAWLAALDGSSPEPQWLSAWFADEATCALAYGILALRSDLANLASEPLLRTGLDSEDPEIAAAALRVASVHRPGFALAWARAALAAGEGPVRTGAEIVAVFGTPEDLRLLADNRDRLGDEAYTELLARSGLPLAGEQLLALLMREGAASAALAGRALTRMTGVDTGTAARVRLSDDEFAEDVAAADATRARAAWDALAPTLRSNARVRAGVDLTALDAPSMWPPSCDMQARFDARLRSGSPRPEWFPLTASLLRRDGTAIRPGPD